MIGARMKQIHSFNQIPWDDLVFETDRFVVFRDAVPVTEGHLLFVPREPTHYQILECVNGAMKEGQRQQLAGLIDGYNIGINLGEAAGQTISWPHVHLIPRRTGDMKSPQGGVRHVIPDRGNYKTSSYYDKPEYDHITGRSRS